MPQVKEVKPDPKPGYKTSEFWGEDREKYNEIEGLYNGIDEVAPRCETDLVTLRQTGLRLFREGIYPPLRGTYFCMEGRHYFLFTMGFSAHRNKRTRDRSFSSS